MVRNNKAIKLSKAQTRRYNNRNQARREGNAKADLVVSKDIASSTHLDSTIRGYMPSVVISV